MFREQYVSTDVSKSEIVGKRTARKIVYRHCHNPARIRLTVVHTLLFALSLLHSPRDPSLWHVQDRHTQQP
jgi:hypothetical protein